MKSSSTNVAWEEKPDDITAQILARMVKKETMLREIVEQSALSFYMGGSALSSILRIGLLIALGVLYFPSKAFSSWGVWPVFALGSLVEARRANRRLDAMHDLENLSKAIDFDHRIPSGR